MPYESPRLLLFNLATDGDDPVLGFTTDWIRELAAYCSTIDVISMRCGRVEVPDNVTVYSLGKERGYSEVRRLARLELLLAKLLRSRRPDGCFSHMGEGIAIAAAPMLRMAGIPITLWYAHTDAGWQLRLAERLVDRLVTPSEHSFPFASPKTVATGHGIDTNLFSAPRTTRRGLNQMLVVGRLSPVKGIHHIIESAVPLMTTTDTHLRIVGPTLDRDRGYVDQLHTLIKNAGLANRVTIAGARRRTEMPREYASADLVVNMSTGALDKTTLEALACRTPVATTNGAGAAVVRRIAPYLALSRPTDLVHACEWFAELDSGGRQELADGARRLVVDEHSLQQLAPRLVDFATTPRGA